jgi:D-alanyl-D-alanine carboxypeptidase
MAWVRSGARNGLRCCVLSLAAVVAVLTITSGAADARFYRRVHFVHYVHRSHAEAYAPPSSSIIVDGNTGQVLQASNPDALRHPASLTKIMTLYLLFERLDAGKIKLDTPLKVSEHAADQDPTKLELKPGQSIAVEDAIKGVVTRSANDAAVVIAESIAGSETEFAKLMTQKAHALGMSHTTYVNASGLPDDDQITTARDQALLGRAIQERFPRYYKYFSTRSFVFHGEAIGNHDHLLGEVDGVDGIKTGFTLASGFNLVTSLHRDGRYIVGVVLGGRSAGERDAHMRELISEHFKEASLKRTAPALTDEAERHDTPQQQVAFAKAPLSSHADPAPTATVAPPTATSTAHGPAGSTDPIQPLVVKTVSYRIAPVDTAPLAPMPMLMRVPAPAAPPAVAPAALRSQASVPVPEAPPVVVASAEPVAVAPAAPAAAPQPDRSNAAPDKSDAAKTEATKSAPAKAEADGSDSAAAAAAAHARGGWLVQIGAYEGEDEAKQHLSDAKSKVHTKLATADSFTERVQKGDKALYRARFAGFDKATAEALCKELKRNDFACMTVKN